MDPILSNVVKTTQKNEPHDLLSRLYREIGISAVAVALEVADETTALPSCVAERRVVLLAAKAA